MPRRIARRPSSFSPARASTSCLSLIHIFGKIVDEDRAALTQTVDDRAVVHDLVPDIDGRAVDGKRTLNDRDGARDARAETARLGKENLHDCHFLVTDFA